MGPHRCPGLHETSSTQETQSVSAKCPRMNVGQGSDAGRRGERTVEAELGLEKNRMAGRGGTREGKEVGGKEEGLGQRGAYNLSI